MLLLYCSCHSVSVYTNLPRFLWNHPLPPTHFIISYSTTSFHHTYISCNLFSHSSIDGHPHNISILCHLKRAIFLYILSLFFLWLFLPLFYISSSILPSHLSPLLPSQVKCTSVHVCVCVCSSYLEVTKGEAERTNETTNLNCLAHSSHCINDSFLLPVQMNISSISHSPYPFLLISNDFYMYTLIMTDNLG